MIFLVYPYDSGYLQLPPYVQLSDKATCLVMPFPFYPHEISPPHIWVARSARRLGRGNWQEDGQTNGGNQRNLAIPMAQQNNSKYELKTFFVARHFLVSFLFDVFRMWKYHVTNSKDMHLLGICFSETCSSSQNPFSPIFCSNNTVRIWIWLKLGIHLFLILYELQLGCVLFFKEDKCSISSWLYIPLHLIKAHQHALLEDRTILFKYFRPLHILHLILNTS